MKNTTLALQAQKKKKKNCDFKSPVALHAMSIFPRKA